VGPEGGVYFVDQFDSGRVRRVSPDGIITTVAGSGNVTPPNLGDEGLAINARVVNPTDVAVDPMGNVYVTAEGRVRKVTPDGIIHTVAGTGPNAGDSTSEGISALQAQIEPCSVAPLGDGSFYFAETGGTPSANGRVRYVDTAGIVRTLAGIGGT